VPESENEQQQHMLLMVALMGNWDLISFRIAEAADMPTDFLRNRF
jgi:hypothetical protein